MNVLFKNQCGLFGLPSNFLPYEFALSRSIVTIDFRPRNAHRAVETTLCCPGANFERHFVGQREARIKERNIGAEIRNSDHPDRRGVVRGG